MTSDNTNQSKISKCGLTKLIVFLLALFFGTGVSIFAKIIMTMPVNDDGSGGGYNADISTVKSFQKPLFLTFSMFVAISLGFFLHWIVLVFHIPFPGYDFDVGEEEIDSSGRKEEDAFGKGTEKVRLVEDALTSDVGCVEIEVDRNISVTKGRNHIPLWMYFYLAVPAIFNFAATIFGLVGLQYLDASISHFLRGGSGLIFVALMKQYILKDRLYTFHWVGVLWIVISVATISSAALLLSTSSSSPPLKANEEGSGSNKVATSLALLGVCQTVIGTFFQACQYVSEEHIMRRAIPAPPLLLTGMEGLWGLALCIIVMFPVGYYIPGDDNGSYEDPFSTLDIVLNSRNIQVALTIYLFFAFLFNLFAVLVTFMLCSMWRSMLDNFRLITVWVTGLLIFYFVNPRFGEMWTKYSYLQIAGLVILLYGTAIYNAPNGGSLRLEGQWWALGINLSKEYDAILQDEVEAEVEAEEDDLVVEDVGKYHLIV